MARGDSLAASPLRLLDATPPLACASTGVRRERKQLPVCPWSPLLLPPPPPPEKLEMCWISPPLGPQSLHHKTNPAGVPISSIDSQLQESITKNITTLSNPCHKKISPLARFRVVGVCPGLQNCPVSLHSHCTQRPPEAGGWRQGQGRRGVPPEGLRWVFISSVSHLPR